MSTFEVLMLIFTFGMLLIELISYLDRNNNTKK